MLVGNPAELHDPRERSAAACRRAAQRVREDRRGLQPQVQLLQHPELPRQAALAARSTTSSREVERLVAGGHRRGEPHQPGHRRLRPRPPEASRSLAELVARVADVPGLRWVRLFYLYPETLTRAAPRAARARTRASFRTSTCRCSTRATRCSGACGAGTAARACGASSRRCARSVPDLVLRSAFIVGHPGETDADFAELCDFVRWAELDHVGVFRYSPEEGTRSADMLGDAVPAKVAAARHRKLMALQRPISRAKLERARRHRARGARRRGRARRATSCSRGATAGRRRRSTEGATSRTARRRPGELRRAVVTEAADYDLVADLLAPDGSRPEPPPGSVRRRGAPGAVATLAHLLRSEEHAHLRD